MPKLKFSAEVSEFGLLKPVAKTRARLIASTVAITAICLGAGIASAHYVLEQSSSVSLNMLLITANMVLVLVAAYVQTMLAGDVFFKGPWREQVLLGDKRYKKDLEVDALVQNHNAEFMIFFILLIIANAVGLNFAAGGFLDSYHTDGFFRVRMRHPEPQERLQAMRDMVEPTQTDLWPVPGIRKVVVGALDDADPEVRAQAVWNTGRMKIDAARPKLLELLGEDPSVEVRAQAGVALGALGQHDASRDALSQVVTQAKQPSPVLVGALRGLGLMKDPEALPAAQAATTHPDQDVWVHGYWVMRQVRDPKTRVFVREALSRPQTDKVRECALLDTLKMVSSKEDVLWARKRFLRAAKDDKCEQIIWEDRDERQRYILYYDRMRTKYMKIIANSGDAQSQKDWFVRIASDPQELWPVREIAGQVLKQLR